MQERHAAALDGSSGGRPVTAGIRPEDILLIGEGEELADVAVVEPTGYESLVFLQRGEIQLVARVGADHPVKALESIPFAFKLDRVHLFDRETEYRIETNALGIA